jgi:hypothetical protein
MSYASGKKPGELTALVTLATDDVFVVGDTSDVSEVAKYITKANLITDLASSFVKQTITNGVTTTAPSEDVVFDALALKAPLASPTFTGTLTVPVGLTGVLRADTGVVSVDTDVTDIVAAGTDLVAGKLELATDAETVTGSDTARATTPANITAKMAAPGAIGATTPSTGKFTSVETTGNIELGHATDTTIARSGAGAITVEGVQVALNSTSLPHTASQFEVGAASDTTIARVGAGQISVEGVNVVTTSSTDVLTNKTIGAGALTLAENASIALDPAGSADGKYSGITIAGTAGATLAFGDLCYLAVADSRWELADADAAATMGTPLLGMCVLAAAADGNATTMLLYGTCRADAKFPALTIGATVYGGETAGAIQTAIPTGADNVIRVVGHALTADEILFNPSQDHQITVA